MVWVTMRRAQRHRDVRTAYLLLAPALLLLLAVLAYPVGWEIWTSLTSYSPLQEGGTTFVGLQNYRQHLEDGQFWRTVMVTVVYTAVTIAAKLGLGLGFALLLSRPFRGRALVFLAVFLPWAYPASVSVMGWYWTLSPPIPTAYSAFMGQLKYTVDSALGGGAWVFLTVTLFNIWRGSSFIGVLLLAGIRSVTVPLLKPFLALGAFLSLTSAFTDIANVWMLTAGRIVFPVLGTQAYWLAIHSGQFGAASALSLLLVPFLLGTLLVLFRLFDAPPRERV